MFEQLLPSTGSWIMAFNMLLVLISLMAVGLSGDVPVCAKDKLRR